MRTMILSMLTPMIPHKIINAHNDTINAHTNDRYHIKLSMLTIILNSAPMIRHIKLSMLMLTPMILTK